METKLKDQVKNRSSRVHKSEARAIQNIEVAHKSSVEENASSQSDDAQAELTTSEDEDVVNIGFNAQIEDLTKKVTALTQETKQLCRDLHAKEIQLEKLLDQIQRSDDLEFQGVRLKDGDDPEKEIINIGESLGITVNASDIKSAFMLISKPGQSQPATIIAKFHNLKIRTQFLQQRNELNRTRSLAPGHRKLYINEHLTDSQRKYVELQSPNDSGFVGPTTGTFM